MNIFKTYYKRIIKNDLINKYTFNNNKDIPTLKKITLNFGCKNFSIQKLAITMLALEILSFKKSSITTAKKPDILLKIQKGQPAGCKVELKNKEIDLFLTRLTFEIIPKLKNFQGFNINQQNSNIFFQIPTNRIMLKEFKNLYPLFTNLPNLDVNILTNINNCNKTTLFFIKSLKLPS